MTAGRCADCGAITVKDHSGAWVLRHENGCPEKSLRFVLDSALDDEGHKQATQFQWWQYAICLANALERERSAV